MGAAGTLFNHPVSGLEAWFEAVAAAPECFVVPSCAFLTIYEQGFMPLDSNTAPSTILDDEGFSPILEMLNKEKHTTTTA
jgi:hypothetical protein